MRRLDALRVYYGIGFFEDVARHAAFTVVAAYSFAPSASIGSCSS